MIYDPLPHFLDVIFFIYYNKLNDYNIIVIYLH